MRRLRISPTTLEYFRYLMEGRHERIVQDGGYFKTYLDDQYVPDLNQIKNELIKPYELNEFLICGSLIDSYCEDGTTAVVKSDSKRSSWYAKFHEDHNFHQLNKIQLGLGRNEAQMQVEYEKKFLIGAYTIKMVGRVDALLQNGNVLDIKSTASLTKEAYAYQNSLQMAYYMYAQQCNVGMICLVPYKMQKLKESAYTILKTHKPKMHYIERAYLDSFSYVVGWLTRMVDFLEQHDLIDHPKFAYK